MSIEEGGLLPLYHLIEYTVGGGGLANEAGNKFCL